MCLMGDDPQFPLTNNAVELECIAVVLSSEGGYVDKVKRAIGHSVRDESKS